MDYGGDPACWAHLVCAECGCIHDDAGACSKHARVPVIRAAEFGARGTASGELNATLMTLEPDGALADAAIDRDVAWTVVCGSGTLVLAVPPDDASRHQLKLEPGMLVVLPAGSRRELVAGASGITWSSVHRRRGPIELGTPSR